MPQEQEGGRTALQLEVTKAQPSSDLLGALLAAGACPDTQDMVGRDTAITIALKAGREEHARLLIDSSTKVGACYFDAALQPQS
jgi:hypothetical protein